MLLEKYDLRMCDPVHSVATATDVDLADGRYVIFTVGVSASGKTTWANDVVRNRDTVLISRDNIRRDLSGFADFSWVEWNKHKGREKTVTQMVRTLITNSIAVGANVIIADTNLREGRVAAMAEQFSKAGYLVLYKYFPIDWKTAVERDNARKNGVGMSVLATQFERVHAASRSLTSDMHGGYIIVDVDGTLAHATSRGIYDIGKVSTDTPDAAIVALVASMYAAGYAIEIVSGRKATAHDDTEAWLELELGVPFTLSMRGADDDRGDDIVKEEILHGVMARHGDLYPMLWIDDRPRVARRIRALGIKVLQVGNPYIEF